MDNGYTNTETFKVEFYIFQCSKVNDVLQLWPIKGSMKHGHQLRFLCLINGSVIDWPT
jgi:hypothetical protein